MIDHQHGTIRDVVTGGDIEYYRDAIWSPDGQRIAALFKQFDGAQCPVTMNANGTGRAKLFNCEADDHPRFWSADGKWIVVWSDRGLKFYAYDVANTQRVPLEQLGKIKLYDERYWPWQVIETPVCVGASFWDCW